MHSSHSALPKTPVALDSFRNETAQYIHIAHVALCPSDERTSHSEEVALKRLLFSYKNLEII